MCYTKKIGLIYYSASKLGRKMNFKLAQRIASNFTSEEIKRIYAKLK